MCLHSGLLCASNTSEQSTYKKAATSRQQRQIMHTRLLISCKTGRRDTYHVALNMQLPVVAVMVVVLLLLLPPKRTT
jgi:hypothetical protein